MTKIDKEYLISCIKDVRKHQKEISFYLTEMELELSCINKVDKRGDQ